MANYAKYTKDAMGHMFKHFERAKDDKGNYIKFGNQDINISKTHLNYNLAPEHNQLDFVHKRLEEVYCLKRKDVNIMCSWVITAPQDLKSEQEKLFFQETYSFLETKYGQENVISAYVHKDEKTPHMHFCFMPVVADEKHGGQKVSAYECVKKKDLIKFHEELQIHLKRQRISCSIINEATKEGNKSIKELKRGTAQQQLKATYEATKKEKKELNNLQKQKIALEREISALKNLKQIQGNVLSDQQLILKIKTENVMLDNTKIKISKSDLMDLQKSALIGVQTKQIYEASTTYLKKAEKVLEKAENKQKKPVKETMERVMLKKKLENYDMALNRCSASVRQAFNDALKTVTEPQKQINHKSIER